MLQDFPCIEEHFWHYRALTGPEDSAVKIALGVVMVVWGGGFL